jgi:hypothetical protein
MISAAIVPEVKSKVQCYDSPIFQRYLKTELTCFHICPMCNAQLRNYTELYYHLNRNHKDKLNTEAAGNALNPLYRVRKLYAERKDTRLVGMGEFFGEIITSAHNQNALLNIIGPMGSGKSNAAMRIGEAVAEYVAKKKGGKPGDYFNINNIAIMRLDSIIPIIQDLDNRQFNIVVMDDIGASYSARDFNKVINKNINKILQTFRDTNTLVILTTPHTFLIDKVARRLAHYQIEMSEKRFSESVAIGKLLEVVDQYRNSGKTHYHFPQIDGVKYKRILFKRASPDIVNEYEKKRKEIRKSMMAESIDNITTAESGVKEGKPEKLPKHLLIAEAVRNKLIENPRISNGKLADELLTSRNTIIKAKAHLNAIGRL